MRPDEGSPPDGWGEPRSRTVTWWDPMIGAHAMHDLSGREYLQAMIDGLVHGGLVCTLLDSVAGCAVHSTLPAGVGYTSLEIKVSYLRPVRHGGGELTATGRVTKPGRRAAFADGEVRDGDGRLVATASSTCLVFPLRDG